MSWFSMCSGQLLASKIHNNFNGRNKTIKLFYNPPYFYLPTQENLTLPYASPSLAHNLLSDQLWAPLLHVLLEYNLVS